MLKPITFELKESYGRPRAYPVSPEAQSFCNLTGSKTLLPQTIATIESLGFMPVDHHGNRLHPSDLY